jgi:cathepsin L
MKYLSKPWLCLTVLSFLLTTPMSASPQPANVDVRSKASARPRGAIIPSNLDQLVSAQNQVSAFTSMLLRATPRKPIAPANCATLPAFNWSDSGKISPVQDQKTCGSCWAFAAIGAYEASYLIENELISKDPNLATASEQEALDCASSAYSCQGGWHDKVFDYLVSPGETTRSKYGPYTAIKASACRNVPQRQYLATRWGYVEGANIPSDATLKTALCEHGPIVAAVNATGWDDIVAGRNYFAYSTANPNWQQMFPGGVFTAAPSKPNLTMQNISLGDIDHDVLIVGWDDAAKAWIIKNSWGTDWGDQGYIKLAYGTANIGFNAAWVEATGTATPLGPSLSNALRLINSQIKVPLTK